MDVRCYFLDENGRITGTKAVQAETVDAAVTEGTKMAKKRKGCDSIEIWRGSERLYPAPTSTVAPSRAYGRSGK